eukprot:SAG31_NODE_27610_length_423_cov_0.796296_1_plen_140_part_11
METPEQESKKAEISRCRSRCRAIRMSNQEMNLFRRVTEHFEDIWEKLDLLLIFFLLFYCTINVLEAAGAVDPTDVAGPSNLQPPWDIVRLGSLAGASIVAFFRALGLFRLQESLGPLLTIIRGMVSNVLTFLVLIVVIIA